MKKLIVLIPMLIFAMSNQNVNMQIEKLKKEFNQKLEKLTQRIDENEFESSLNRIKWGGEFITRWGFYSGKRDGTDYSNPNKWDMRLSLDMEAKINSYTKFTGRLMMSKAWGDSNGLYLSKLDALQGRANGTSSLYVERAYVDYYFNKHFVVTIGRQPSSDGPGMNLKYNTPRKATYPALIFNGAADGIVFTYKQRSNTFRFAYGKGYQWQDRMYGWSVKNPGIKDTNVYGLFYEKKFPYSLIGKNILIFTLAKTTHLVTNPFDDNNATANRNLGDYEHLGVYFENLKIFKRRFNYFISFAYSIPKGNGNYGIADMNNDGIPDTPVKLLKNNGYAYHIGVRYDIEKFKLGYEYNHASRYWFSFSTNLYDPMNKLAIRGHVHDFYMIYQPDLFQFMRIGYMYAKENYAYSGMYYAPNGIPPKADNIYKIAYITYDVRW